MRAEPASDAAESLRAVHDAAQYSLITPDGRGLLIDFGEMWAYREVFYALFLREIKIRYAQTIAGAFWVILQPVLTTAVLAFLTGHWIHSPADGLAYPLLALSGLIPWMYFNHTLTKSSVCLISTGLISKAYFPRLLLVLAAISAGLIDLFVALPVLALVMIGYRTPPGWTVFLLPLGLALVLVAAMGAGIWLAVLNLYYRDVANALPFGTQLLFFLTPAAYPISMVPKAYRLWYSLNPMVAAIEFWRWSIFDRPFPMSASEVTFSVASGLAIFLSGLWYFRSEERVFADVGS